MKQDINEIEINGVKYLRADAVASAPAKGPTGPLVIIRSTGAGVHIGEMARRTPTEVTLHNARRLWSWSGANTLNEVSQNGVSSDSKISEPVPQITIANYHEVIPVSTKAAPSLTKSGWGK